MTLEKLLTSIRFLQEIMIYKGKEVLYHGFAEQMPYSVLQNYGESGIIIRPHNFNRIAIEILPEPK